MASRSALCLLAFVTSISAADLAPSSTYEGKPIAHVRFDPPAQPLAKEDLDRLMTVKPGEPLRLTDVRSVIKNLYSSGQYSDVEVDTEPSGDGLTLVFRTTDQWFVGPIEVHGKTKSPPNSGQLANATRLELGTPFSDGDVQTAVEGMRRLLQRNGLYHAEITPKVDRDVVHQEVGITFDVTVHKRAKLTNPVITGDTRIPPEKVAKATHYKVILFFPWKAATNENVQTGIQNIRKKYEKQDRLTADVTLKRTEFLDQENRVRPYINADGGPKIKFQAEGAKVSKVNFEKYVPVFDEETVNRDLLVTGARNLRDYFENKGYFDVEVDFNTKDIDRDHENITYLLTLGERHTVVKVVIQGNKFFRTEDIREHMFTQPKGFMVMRRGRYSQSFANRDQDVIKSMYRNNGFRDTDVKVTTVDDYKGRKGDVAVTFTITEGPRYLVSHLTLDGVPDADRATLQSNLSSIPGEPFSEINVALDRGYVLRYYQERGFPSVTFDSRTAPGPGDNQIDVQYHVDTGDPQYVRDLVITGLRITRRRLINPALTLKPGDPLSWTQMGDMQRNLYDLGIFDKVDMAIQNSDGDVREKYVDYHFTEGHLYNFAVGFGAELARFGGSQTSLDNPNGATGFAPRFNLEMSRQNLWGLGHSLNFKGRYSTLDRRLSLNYLAPRFHNVEGRNISVTALYDNTRDVLTFTAVRLQGALQVSKKLTKATNMFFRYSWTDNRVDTSTLKISPFLIPLYSQATHVGMTAVNVVQDRRDNSADAHRGFFNSLDLGLAEHYFGGNRNFLRFLGRNSYYKTVHANVVLPATQSSVSSCRSPPAAS